MASVIKIKRSAIQGKAPNTSTISSGEIALNTNDGKLFSTDGVRVFEIGANVSSLSIGSNSNLVFSSTGKLHANNAIANATITSNMLDKTYLDTAGGTMTGFITLHSNPTSPLHAATRQYVDEVAVGLKISPAVRVATTVNLSASYDNGANGVGATLTSTSNTAFPEIDGVTITTTEFGKAGVLVKDQANTAHNGRYNLTTVGNNTTSWVLTKCIFCDEAEEIPGSYVFVQGGNIYAGTAWVALVNDPATFTVGTDGVTYTQFTGGASYTFDGGLRLVGSVVSLDVGNLSVNAAAIDANDFLAIHDVSSNTTIKAKISDVALQGPQGPPGPPGSGGAGGVSNTKNSNTTSEIVLDSWDKDVYLSAKYIVQIKSTTNPNKVQTSEVLLVHNGSSTFSTEYAIVAISNTIATIASDIDSGLVRLKVTPSITGTKITALRTTIET